MKEHHHTRGLLFALLAALSRAVMATLVKLCKDESIFTLIFFRNIVSLIVLFPLFFPGELSLKTRRPILHGVRALMGMGAIYCYFYSIQHLDLIEAIVLSNTSPLYIPFVAWIWLRTPISSRRLFSIFLGFVGVLLVLRPGYGIFHTPASFVGLLGAVCSAISFVSVKQLTRTEKTPRILFYYFLYCVPCSFFPMLFSLSPSPSLSGWIYIFLIGAVGLGYQASMTRAYHFLAATKVASLLYATVIFGAIIDWAVWGSQLDLLEALGGALIILGGLWALLDRKKPLHLGKKPPLA
ncbi:MAG: DMT family transporter [Chlamydiota bacterium]